MDTETKQLITNSEKAKDMIERKYKADYDLVLYWHYQSIREELVYNYLKDIK
jgi:hypothetical protein